LLIASEEQFKLFSLPQLKPINKYKLTAHEGARVRRIHFGSFSCHIPADLMNSIASGGSPSKSTRSHDHTAEMANTSMASGVADETRNYHEMAMMCLTNLGDIMILSVPELKRQLNCSAVRREDINGISSLCFTNAGEALYMMSSSEVQRLTLATAKIVLPQGVIEVEPLVGGNESSQLEDEGDVDAHRSVNGIETMSQKQSSTTMAAPTHVPVPKERVVTTTTTTTTTLNKPLEVNTENAGLHNGINGTGDSNSPNRANETITSSIGDITVDSVRDHLNTTTTTLHTTTTEETVAGIRITSGFKSYIEK